MGSEIGIGLRVDAQTDSLRNAAQDFDKFAEKVSSVLGITDPEKVEQFWDEYNSGIEKASLMMDRFTMIEKRGSAPGVGGSSQGTEQRGKVIPFPGSDVFKFERTMKNAVGGLSRDAGGAVVGAGESIIDKIGEKWNQMPAMGKVALGAGALTVGGLAIGNELSKQYESVVPAVMSSTAALKRFASTADEQSKLFRTTMSEISVSASGYGYTFQQGAAVVEQLARLGATDAMSGASGVMGFAKGYGFQNIPSEFTELYGTASRFGKGGLNALKYAAGGAGATVGSPRISEYMTAMTSMFEDGLSEGIVKGFGEISRSQNFLYNVFGEVAGGRRGAEVYSRMNGSVVGASGLRSETDLLLYRAARDKLGENASAVDIQMELEKGFNPELFKKFKGSISGGSRDDQIRLISKAFGVNLTMAERLYSSKDGADVGAILGSAPGGSIAGTAESQYVGNQERITNDVRKVGAEALDVKNMVLGATANFADFLTGGAAIQAKTVEINSADTKVFQRTKDNLASGDKTKDPYDPLNATAMVTARNRLDTLFGDIIDGSGASGKGDVGKKVNSILTNNANLLSITGMGNDTYKKLMEIDKQDKGLWTQNELAQALTILTQVVSDNTKAQAAQSNVQVNVYSRTK